MGDILCPNCKSKDTEFDDLKTNPDGSMISLCSCNQCKHKWETAFQM